MTKPIYPYPYFVSEVALRASNGKRYWLRLKIDESKPEGITVILKNPSRANQVVSDKTVFNVANYIYRNNGKYAELENIGSITIVNLIPYYLTNASRLKTFKERIIDQENSKFLKKVCAANRKVIIAWGNHPPGLYNEYEELKQSALQLLTENKNDIFFVDRMTKAGNPKHGQVWGYDNRLIKYLPKKL